MIFDESEFEFDAPPAVARASRVLIKPYAAYPLPYPVATSREALFTVIRGIRRVSDADIIILEGTPTGYPMSHIYKMLGYDFPRVITLDVRDCISVDVENPLPKPFATSTFGVPNILLACDYLITMTPFRILGNQGDFTVRNLLSLILSVKQQTESYEHKPLLRFPLPNLVADFYFTLPFDLGIIEGQKKFICTDNPTQGVSENYGKIFLGEPFQVDTEASEAAGVNTEYLQLVAKGKADLKAHDWVW